MLLGASNVTLGFGPITRLLRDGFPGSLDVRAALGHGRSYGAWSSILGRSLPSVIDCGLWHDLATAPPADRTAALLTDVGNDLLYGFLPEEIAGWVGTCLARLGDAGADTIVTRLPIARAERLTAAHYHTVRFLFFARHKPVTWAEMYRRAIELDDRVAEVATQAGVSVVTPPAEWYAVDPIHIRWSRRVPVWGEIFSRWPGFDRPQRLRSPGLPLPTACAQRCRLLGRDRDTPQPVYAADGVTLSLY